MKAVARVAIPATFAALALGGLTTEAHAEKKAEGPCTTYTATDFRWQLNIDAVTENQVWTRDADYANQNWTLCPLAPDEQGRQVWQIKTAPPTPWENRCLQAMDVDTPVRLEKCSQNKIGQHWLARPTAKNTVIESRMFDGDNQVITSLGPDRHATLATNINEKQQLWRFAPPL